jgi:signal peptidase I
MSNIFTAKAKAQNGKKELTPKQKKLKTVGNWIVNVICILLILFALFIAIMSITRSTSDAGIANIGGTAFMPVKSDSMEPTFNEDDLILTKLYDGDGTDLKVGQVITYEVNKNGIQYLNTHRIVKIDTLTSGQLSFVTRGDNESNDDYPILVDKIVATWGSVKEDGTPVNGDNWGQIGAAINWLQEDSLHFFLAVVLPLILLFVIYAFVLIRTLVIAKISKAQSETAAAAATAQLSAENLSDEEKRRLAEELLKSLNQDKSRSEDAGAEKDPSTDEKSADTATEDDKA